MSIRHTPFRVSSSSIVSIMPTEPFIYTLFTIYFLLFFFVVFFFVVLFFFTVLFFLTILFFFTTFRRPLLLLFPLLLFPLLLFPLFHQLLLVSPQFELLPQFPFSQLFQSQSPLLLLLLKLLLLLNLRVFTCFEPDRPILYLMEIFYSKPM
ncbi:hypothetical protein FR483_n450L [Paramecium bursaria Chlorella virus FR483]|uniref:Uncharacterized protein n450L n=1 Tax=Paramecium bursaria Chlorella virus FR483 TaxID=399781 RepID=A7J7F4_PBCVF|nr:hypothetical protein FR483_n450L [Paramecium bursaria Chlorella virus FR483]ABT15735.1 hypothetical protein FR483_n450L [Paramecium bursaria Chlorella virus FR483]